MAKADENGMANAAGIAYGELIRRQRKAKHMSQEELGALVRVKKNAVGAWEAGRSRPDVSSVPVICDALDMTLDEFFGLPEKGMNHSAASMGISPEERSALLNRYSMLNEYNRQVILRQMAVLKELEEEFSRPRKVIRLYRSDLAVSAGPGEALDAARGEVVFLYADPVTEGADEIIRVNGDSMEPTYQDGDQVLVRHTGNIRPGEIGVFVCGDTGYIKEYQRDGLHSHNPAYATISFDGEDAVRCVGKVLGVVSPHNWADEEAFAAWMAYESGR